MAFGLFDESEGERLVSGLGRGIDLTQRIVLGAGHEGFDGTNRLSLDPKDDIQLAVKMGFGHCKGRVSPIRDDDTAIAQMVEMREHGAAFIVVFEEIDIDRHTAEQAGENADKALRRVGIGMRFAIAQTCHGDGEMILWAINGEDRMAFPEVIMVTMFEHVLMHFFEDLRVKFSRASHAVAAAGGCSCGRGMLSSQQCSPIADSAILSLTRPGIETSRMTNRIIQRGLKTRRRCGQT